MYVKATAPRSIGGILDDAIRLYREAFAKTWPLALCGQVVLAVPLFIMRMQIAAVPGVNGNPMAAAANPAAALQMVKSPVFWLSYLVALMLIIGINNALISRLDGIASAKMESLGLSVTRGFRLLPRTVLLFLAMFAVIFIAGIFVGIGAAILRTFRVAQAIFLAAAVALGIYVGGRAFLANTALVVEDAGVFKSLKISWTLIKNHWWRTGTVYGVGIIIALVFYFVIGFANGLILALLRGSLETATIVTQLTSIAGGTVLMAFFPAVLLSVYYDLKLRKEGTDLASRVNALAP